MSRDLLKSLIFFVLKQKMPYSKFLFLDSEHTKNWKWQIFQFA